MALTQTNIKTGRWTSWLLLCALLGPQAVAEVETFNEAHIHYDQDVWQPLSAKQAVQMLEQQGIERALVSATPTDGAEKLYRIAPDYIVPMLRPYRSWRHRYYWYRDPELKQYLLQHLARAPYRGFGEFHVFGDDVASVPVGEMIELARQRQLVLHAHTDLPGMRVLLQKTAGVPVIWAHGGFDVPVATLRELLAANSQLYIELSYREGLLDPLDQLTPEWKAFLLQYPDRFLVGMDTWKPSRWAELPELAERARLWLSQLPEAEAELIARKNFDRLFPRQTSESH